MAPRELKHVIQATDNEKSLTIDERRQRQQQHSSNNDPKDDKYNGYNIDEDDKCIKASTTLYQHHQKQRFILFRIGPLRFGIHGITGIFGLIFVSWALLLSYYNTATIENNQMDTTTPMFLSILIVITTLTSSIGSYGLLNQVPNTSHISSWIFPPHREAFKRTIAISGYLNLRLIQQWLSFSAISESSPSSPSLTHAQNKDQEENMIILRIVSYLFQNESLIFPILLLLYTNYHFLPRTLDYRNGNTWVFVIPMFIGFNIDTLKQFPSFDLKLISRNIFSNEATAKSINENSKTNNLDWEKVYEWNAKRVNETYLLLTLFCTLQIAFMFTIAFRGKMSIKSCYWIAAIEVGLLCNGLF